MNLRNPTEIEACLAAGAIGDALGSHAEGSRVGWVPAEIPLEISDDTQLSLATCMSIVQRGAVDPEHLAARFAEDYQQRRYRGLGASTTKALLDLANGAHWSQSGCRGERAAGNGAAMRVAPLAFLLDPERPAERQLLSDVCRITHHTDEAYLGALSIARALRRVRCSPQHLEDALLEHLASALPDCRVRDALRALERLPLDAPLQEAAAISGTSGFVAASVPLALFAAQRAARLELGVLLRDVITLGGDTDTIAALVGQIAGAALGWGALPVEDGERIVEWSEVLETAASFARFVERRLRGSRAPS